MADRKESSRKWKLAKWSFWTLVGLLVIPGVTSLILALAGTGISFQLLSGQMFITGLGLVVGLYGASNVFQKFTHNNKDEDGSGGQPPESF